ncbi:MAG TPA: GTPase [Alphaproteobacteria bacterium]|nr:GTPase [Alphaproteobacteria bacterium]
MRLKSFHAPTMAEAMSQVRAALGDDAIIVATRDDEDGQGVRVTAAIEDDAFAAASTAAPPTLKARPPEPEPFEDEVDPLERVGDALFRHGLPSGLTDKLLATMQGYDTDDMTMALAAALDAVFDFNALPEGAGQRHLMLVGPPGAGKTLTVAKLATRAVMRGRRIGVATTDTVRAGGVEQLQAFTRLLKVDLLETEDPHSLADGLSALSGVEQVLIDTAGRNPYQQSDMLELAKLIKAGNIEPVLVLPAGGDAQETVEMAGAFRAMGVRRLLPTRLDMTRRLGPLLTVAYEARLSFCEGSQTAKVPEGLTTLTPGVLARLLLPQPQRAAAPAAKQTGTYR